MAGTLQLEANSITLKGSTDIVAEFFCKYFVLMSLRHLVKIFLLLYLAELTNSAYHLNIRLSCVLFFKRTALTVSYIREACTHQKHLLRFRNTVSHCSFQLTRH